MEGDRKKRMKIIELAVIILAIIVIVYQQIEIRKWRRQVHLLSKNLEYWEEHYMSLNDARDTVRVREEHER